MTYPLIELSGTRLDQAVARAEGLQATWHEKVDPSGTDWITVVDHELADSPEVPYAPSRSWCDGGPIIEREKIELRPFPNDTWLARAANGDEIRAETPLLAAMRVYTGYRIRPVGSKP